LGFLAAATSVVSQEIEAAGERGEMGMGKKAINEDVLAVLSECRADGNVVFITGGTLDRSLYEGVNKVLIALGGKWNRKTKGHVFESDPSTKLDDCINSGTVTPLSRNGFFPTPIHVVSRLLELANIEPNSSILEPSAGDGAIAKEIARRYPHNKLALCEVRPDLRAKMNGLGSLIVENDFFDLKDCCFDRIVMNPPFERLADITHVNHAWELLALGGRLVSVMSSGVTFRREEIAERFRENIRQNGTIEHLPEGSFSPSGTMVNTVIAVLNKPHI
jgi:hypothetical protein